MGSRYRKDSVARIPLRLLRLAKCIHFRAPVHQNLAPGDRCAHLKSYYGGRNKRIRKDGSNKQILRLNQLFEQLPENFLRSFGWQLATCVPVGLLGAGAPLVERQAALETLSLITFPCPSTHKRESPVLTAFKRVKNFSWIGLMAIPDLESVRDFLSENYEILETLELDFLRWKEVEENWRTHYGTDHLTNNIFAEQILSRGPNNTWRKLSCLSSLSLSEAPFSNAFDEIASALNFSQLRSLKLRCCASMMRFLLALITSNTPIVLTTLEITTRDFAEGYGDLDSILVRFLNSFHGLEELHLLVQPVYEAYNYWQALKSHVATLRNFLYHERCSWPGNRRSDQYTGSNFEWGEYGHEERTTFDRHPRLLAAYRYLRGQNLHCLGTCDTPSLFKEQMLELDDWPGFFSLKLLHIRWSDPIHEDMCRFFESCWFCDLPTDSDEFGRDEDLDHPDTLLLFAQWAFSWKQFPRLQIMAFGNTAYDGRHPSHYALFCRNLQPDEDNEYAFRMMTRTEGSHNPFQLANHDMVHFEGIYKPFEFLGACPVYDFCNFVGPDSWPS